VGGVSLTHFLVLGALYALAEVLPIGATAHFAWLDGWFALPSAGSNLDAQAFGLGLHIGLLLTAALYFWQDIVDMVTGLIRVAKGKRDPSARLAFQLVVAIIPTVAAVVGLRYVRDVPWTTPTSTGWTAFGVGMLVLLFDRACMTVKRIEHAGYGDAILLGIAQMCAIVPGVGRIAILVAMARLLGYERRDAARFAFLISIPTLAAAAAWNTYGLVTVGAPISLRMVALGVAIALVVGLPVLAAMMNWLRRSTFTPFAVYRLVMAANLVAFAHGWLNVRGTFL
jgi:undecaprenyl-diphosphatase